LSHVISGEKTLKEIVIEGPNGIKIIPAASGVKVMAELSPVQHAGLIHAFSELTDEIDVLLVDTAAGISDSVVSFCRASQEVIVVVCDEPASLVDAFALMKILNRDNGVNRFHILSNMTHSTQEGRDLYAKLVNVSDKYLDITANYMGAIPYDDYLRKAVKQQRPVVNAFPRSRAAVAFKNLAQKADKWPRSETPGGHLEFFVERLIRPETSEAESHK
jgi:flagellar biosynthesis protein FlhG